MSEEIELPKIDHEFSDEDVVLDPYNSDLNLIIDKECLLANPISSEGFAMMWGGCRATYGVSSGRAAFEVFLTDYCESEDIPKDDQESYAIRVGWSLDTCSMQLGTDEFSYAYCSNGKKLNKSIFQDYGESFEKNDSVAAYIDYETDSNSIIISFSKNGTDLGTAFVVPKSEFNNEQSTTFFPHILSKNIVFEVNFGQRVSVLGDEPFAPLKTNYELIQKLSFDKRVRGEVAPNEQKDCQVIMLVGLPGCGKTYWAKELCKNNPKKHFNILGISSIMDKMKTYDTRKRTSSTSNISTGQSNTNISTHTKLNVELFEKASKCMNKLIEFASQLNRNIILDQYNVYGSARRRKMKLFEAFNRKAVVIVPNDDVYKERIKKSENEEGRELPISLILNMKASFNLPKAGELFDSVEYVELDEIKATELIEKYNLDGPAVRLQLVLDKRSKLNDENRQADLRTAATAIRLQRSGYGYGKESRFYRSPFQSNKRPYIPHQRFGTPPFGMRPNTLPYGYGVQPVAGWNPALPHIWPQQQQQQQQSQSNEWMPALPINPYQQPLPQQQHLNWQTQAPHYIQQQQQQQQSQMYNNWTPAMATNVTNITSNQNTTLNNNINNQKP